MNEIVFKSAFDAVRFALCYSSQQFGETIMAKRMRGPGGGSGMGLVGLDGAGQVGMIRRELEKMPELHLCVVVARAAPQQLACECGHACCSRWRPKRPVQKLPRGAVYFLGKLLTLGIRTTEVQGWKRQSLTTNCGY
nr:hypothetical protein [Burkholderia glumae]